MKLVIVIVVFFMYCGGFEYFMYCYCGILCIGIVVLIVFSEGY